MKTNKPADKKVCPNCKKEIEFLTEDRIQHAFYRYDGEFMCQFNDYGNIESQKFYCPECDTLLFDNDNDANLFLA